jgi:hypothetical protein
MKVTYTAGPDDVTVWEFEPDDVPQSQAELIEKRYGKNWDSFLGDVRSGSAKARRVLLWHMLRQTHHTLRLEDVPDFKMGAVKVEHSVAELVEVRDRVAKSSLPDEDKEGLLAALDVEITEAMAGDESGKAEVTEASTTS